VTTNRNRLSTYPYTCRSCGRKIYLVIEKVQPAMRNGMIRKSHVEFAAVHEDEMGDRKAEKQHRQGDILRVRLEERCRNQREQAA
jgi:hypothetical protein